MIMISGGSKEKLWDMTYNKQRHDKTTPSSKSSLLLLFYFLSISFVIFGLGRHVVTTIIFWWPTAAIKEPNVVKNEATEIVELPPLEVLISPKVKVIGDISWMLDFAVIAFPKSGTTFMKGYLNKTAETYVYEREFCMKNYSSVAVFVKEYYELHVKLRQPRYPKTIRFGLKCPGVFYRADDIHIYKKYFPTTKFIVGLRHPVSWFGSFYNYQSYRNITLPKNTSTLIGKCSINHEKVCTDRARFHAGLARLGKTPMQDEDEMNLLFGLRYDKQQQQPYSNATKAVDNTQSDRNLRKHGGLPNQVLLYEIRQIHDKEISKQRLVPTNIKQYLGIHEDLPPILSYKQKKKRAINICDDEHKDARRILVEHGVDAAIWIKRYFLKSDSVEVISQNSFHRFIGDWGVDPCSNLDTNSTA